MDTLCLKSGILSPVIAAVSFGGGGGAFEVRTNQSQLGAAAGRASDAISVENPAAEKAAPRRLLFGFPLRYLWPGGVRKRGNGVAIDDAVLVDDRGKAAVGSDPGLGSEGKDESWVLKILHVRSRWTEQGKVRVEDLEKKEEGEVCDTLVNGDEEEDEEECDVCRVDEEREEEEIKFDRESFSRLLRRVTLTEAKFYAQMSYLGNLAYSIPNIKARNLLRYYKLRFVTSSMEKKGLSTKSEEDQTSMGGAEAERNPKEAEECKDEKNSGYRINASTAYQIAASAASYLHYHTKSILPFNSSKGKACEEDNEITTDSVMKSDVASFMATSDSVTAVVAAKEEVKQAVADDLSSTFSSPCEWFICDDDQKATRFFVIQGSESLASWQANLLFEPIQFEGLDVLVHRGIYEAAKGIYEQMLPEVRSHVRSHGNRATFRFTGHSLGGSLALLVNLMLLTRGEVPLSLLLPVITFGSPSIICGGDRLLRKLGLPRSHVQAITMHRDIVPRAFSCNYPSHVAELLKAINGNFRNHPCLNHQSLLYTPMGELLILQPEEKFSPHHHLLPPGSGIYLLSSVDARRQIVAAAQMAFLNSPHPLEILHDRSSYGSDGKIQRDHDMNSYVKCIRGVIRKELNHVRKAKREHRRKLWWPLVMSSGRPLGFNRTGSEQVTFSGVLQTGRQSFKRFTRLVASQHMHLLVVLMLPARLFVLGAFTGITFFQ